MAATYESLPVIQQTAAWLEAKEHGVGASEDAAALGLSRWESKYSLWARKCRLAPPPLPTLAMEIGTITEPLNAARYEEATGVPLRRVRRLLRSKAHPFLLASLDRRRPDKRLVELKWTERGDGYGEPGTDEVPDEVLCQAIHQMAVTGAPAVDISVLFGGRRHAIYTIERDLDAEAAVIEQVTAFWRHVEERTEPPLDASDSTGEALRARYAVDDGSVLEAGEELAADLLAYRASKAGSAVLEKEQKELRIRIDAAIGAASTVEWPGEGVVTYRAPKDSVVVAWPKVAEAYRSAYTAQRDGTLVIPGWLDDAQLDALEGLHTTTTPNARRLLLPKPKEETDA